MAKDTEKYLLDSLDNAIKESKLDQHILLTKLAPLHTQFVELHNFLQSNATPSRREKLYYLNNVLTHWQVISKKSPYTPQALKFAYNLTRNLKKIQKKLKEGDTSSRSSVEDHTTQVDDESTQPAKTYQWSSPYVDATKLYHIEDKVLFMERLLLQQETNDFKAIGVVGMAGIGKTTLCQVIFNEPKVREYFLPRIWVCMSVQANEDTDNKKEIVKRILTCLGVEDQVIKAADEGHGLQGLLFALRLQLMGKKYLIVLDHAWNDDKFFENLEFGKILDEKWDEHLSSGLPKGCGGRVIVTSRVESLAKKMVGEENLYFPKLYSDPDSCWLIFKDWAEKDGLKFPPGWDILKDEIVRKCGGLPLAAKMMGQIMNEHLKQILG